MNHKRLARGSETGGQQMAIEAAKTIAAHKQVQDAAGLVSAELDELSMGRPLISGGADDSMILAIERAQRQVNPSSD